MRAVTHSWLCDREPPPQVLYAPLDARNVRGRDLATIGPNYSWESLRIYHYLEERLEPLEHFARLKRLELVWAPKVTDISPIGRLQSLEELTLHDLKAVRDLEPLGELGCLRALSIEGGMNTAMRTYTLRWISALKELRTIELFLRVEDHDITVLTRLDRLESLRLANLWPLEQFAVLAAKFGPALKWPLPVTELPVPCPKCADKLVMLIGKGRPSLCRRCDAARLERELDKYEKALAKARADVG